MPTPVLMPQMGESIAEGTIVRWIKKVGEAVDRDEPLFEISTDKVDAEIPAPAAGVLTEIKVKEGETVAVNSVVATIGAASEIAIRDQGSGSAIRCRPGPNPGSRSPIPDPRSWSMSMRRTRNRPSRRARPTARSASKPAEDDSRKQRSSPLVRRIARDNDVDISQIQGSGLGGRVTKNDILGYIETRDPGFGIRDPGFATNRVNCPSSPESRVPSPA